jgi:hypothetical protein
MQINCEVAITYVFTVPKEVVADHLRSAEHTLRIIVILTYLLTYSMEQNPS